MIKGVKHRRNETAILTLARNIKKYRKVKKLTVAQLAEIVDMDTSQIGRMERGQGNPNISMIYEIAMGLDIKAAQLMEE